MLDPIPTFLVKERLDILIQTITQKDNLSFNEGVFIDPLKQAIVTPLIMKPSLAKDDIYNYRPVSGLSFILKVVDHVVASRLKSHLAATWTI